MKEDKLKKIEELIEKNEIDLAQIELSKLGQDFNKNPCSTNFANLT